MTEIRSALVRKEALAKTARRLDFGAALLLSRGEEGSGGRRKDYLLANSFEAVVGILFLESGLAAAREFIARELLPMTEEILKEGNQRDPKSIFQELAQEKRSVTPTYQKIAEEGPDHAKVFRMAAMLGKEKVAEGEGSSKQAGEEAAAGAALEKLGWEN